MSQSKACPISLIHYQRDRELSGFFSLYTSVAVKGKPLFHENVGFGEESNTVWVNNDSFLCLIVVLVE